MKQKTKILNTKNGKYEVIIDDKNDKTLSIGKLLFPDSVIYKVIKKIEK